MSRRSDQLKNFLEPIQQPAPTTASEPVPRAKPTVHSGALNSMNQAIANLATEAEEAERLRGQLEAGDTVVELDPAVIHRSFVKDRLDDYAGASFIELRESMRNSGQIVPVLVRPHPKSQVSINSLSVIAAWRRFARLAQRSRQLSVRSPIKI